MKQRVSDRARARHDSQFLLMDEPFGALDALTRERLQEELLEIWRRTHLTVLFVTHSMEEAVLLSDRVVVMTAGPGRIESDYRVALPRPRDVSSPEFNDIRRRAFAKAHQPCRQARRLTPQYRSAKPPEVVRHAARRLRAQEKTTPLRLSPRDEP